MNRRTALILAGGLALFLVLVIGAVAGSALVYFALQASPVQAGFGAQVAPDHNQGVLLAAVISNGPAAQAGLVRGDILTAIDNTTINTAADLTTALSSHKPGDTLNLTIIHGDEQRTVSVTLGENPNQVGQAYLGVQPCLDGTSANGFGRNFARKFQGQVGILVDSVVSGSPAEQAGLKQGDLITSIDGQAIQPGDNLATLIQKHKPGDQITLSVQSSGDQQAHDVTVTLGENPNQAGQAYLGIQFSPALGGRLPGNGTNPALPFQAPGNNGDQQMPFNHPPFTGMPQLPEGIDQAVFVGQVTADGPAAQAGLQAGDIITAVDGTAVSDPTALADQIHQHKPGDQVALTVYRSGQSDPMTINVTLGDNPNQAGQAYLGVTIGAISNQNSQSPQPSIPFPFFNHPNPNTVPGEGA